MSSEQPEVIARLMPDDREASGTEITPCPRSAEDQSTRRRLGGTAVTGQETAVHTDSPKLDNRRLEERDESPLMM